MQLSQQQIDFCMECGVCTGSCPVSMTLEGFSPRQMIKRTMADPEGDILESKDLWACLSCSRCSDRCPVKIDFPAFIRTFREKAVEKGNTPRLSHHGMFQTISSIQAAGTVQNRIQWAKEAGQIAETGDYFYFTGCIPYYDVAFKYLDLQMIDHAKNIVRILNRMGIEPVVSNDECCCGHDAWWNGDETTFSNLAGQNMKTIKQSGAKTVIFGCPEGYSVFREGYAQMFGELEFEIIHITEFLARELPESGLAFKPESTDETITFQDPCRLGRRSGIYEAPRELIRKVSNGHYKDMAHNRENAICCGTTAWMECSACSKAMQIQRLEEASQIGADTIVTACPKCQIHLTCTKKNTNQDIRVVDLMSYIADHLE
ncbi:MAG: (Fe-S)-binding protein [Desulfobacteraceae bacterium]|nr:MAG: (Fe-S)-binding protein [Desulfobacteraceae bacterium]